MVHEPDRRRHEEASNPSAPACLLEQLAQDQDSQVRQAVASNPNTPWQTLEKLALEFPHEFLHNPAGPLQMMAHPEQISCDGLLWDALLREVLPALWWSWLLSQPVLCAHPTLHLHIQSVGEASSYAGSQEEEEDVLLVLTTLLTVACAQQVPLPVLRRPDQSTFPGEQIIRAYLHRLASSGDKAVRKAVAGNSQTPRMLLSTLAQDRVKEVRRSVASNPQTPVEVLRTLAQNRDEEVRGNVASNSQTPVEVLLILAQDTDGWTRRSVAWNPRVPVEVLLILAQDRVKEVRRSVASNPQTPVEVLLILAQDTDAQVRRATAWNPQVPVELLHALAQDEDENVRRTGRFIQRLLVEVKGLGQEEGEGGWQLYRLPHDICNRRPTAIEWQLERVTALDVTSPIRQAILVAFAADWDAAMIQHAFSRRNDDFARRNRGEWKYTDLTYNVKWEHIMAVFMPPIALRKLATSPFWEVRYLVALHPRTPWETRESLSQDGNRYVRAMARANMTPDGIFPRIPVN